MKLTWKGGDIGSRCQDAPGMCLPVLWTFVSSIDITTGPLGYRFRYSSGIPLQILINDGIKQLFRLPGTPRKKLIVGVPVLLGAAQYTGCFGKWCGRPWLLAKPARARLHAGACGDRRKHPSSPPSTSRHSAGPASRLPTFESEDVLIAAQEPLATSNLFDQRGHDRLPIQTSPMQFLNTVQNLGNMERLAGSAEYVLHHI